MKMTRLASQTYRLGDYVIYKTERGTWLMGQPLVADDPLGGFVAGTVTRHTTLADARRYAAMMARSTARQEASRITVRHPSQSRVLHVVRTRQGWAVTSPIGERVLAVHPSRADAIREASARLARPLPGLRKHEAAV